MISVKNTRELEAKYNLTEIEDDEKIMVYGGMEGKSKYDDEYYKKRITYSAKDLKKILQIMKTIEANIPENWNKLQRAKYIYTKLANIIEYNHDKKDYEINEPSNLSVLISKKGICAGYALVFKEMMDRQGIECDYIRGHAYFRFLKKSKHAWNILKIAGIQIPVDLTSDSAEQHYGRQRLLYFGNDKSLLRLYKQDKDEKKYDLTIVDNKFVDSIDITLQPTSKENLYSVYGIKEVSVPTKENIGENNNKNLVITPEER